MQSRTVLGLLLAGSIIGCTTVTDPDASSAPLFAAGGGGGAAYSGAHIVVEELVNAGTSSAPNWIATRIHGDGRNRFGQSIAPLNEYQGTHCGVRTILYDQKPPGGLDFDPDTYYNASTMSGACGAPRSLNFDLGGPTPVSVPAHVLVPDIWQFAAGEARLLAIIMGGPNIGCQLRFDAAYTGASPVLATRLPDGTGGVRRWLVESQGNHQAACLFQNPKSGKFTDNGTRYFLPFALTVTQVPPPGSSYP